MSINLGPAGPAPSSDEKTQMRSALGITLGTPADIHAATSKATPVDADEIPLSDSAASWGLKKITWANLKATLKTYFDTIYLSFAGAQSLTSGQKSQAVSNLGLVITRTAAETTMETLVITGVTADYNGDAPPVLLRAIENGTQNGRPVYLSVIPEWGEGVSYSGTAWEISIGDNGNPAFIADAGNEATPDLVTNWNAQGSAAGPPTVALTNTTVIETDPAFDGQTCIVGTIRPLLFRGFGGAWYLAGPSGVLEDNENPGAYRHIIFDGLALSSEAYTPAD